MRVHEDQKIIEQLQNGNSVQVDETLFEVYKLNHGPIRSFILKNKGSNQDAEDIFQEAMIIFYNQIRKKDFKLSSAISTYLYSVCKNLWLKELNRRKETDTLDEVSEAVDLDGDFMDSLLTSERDQMVMSVVERLGKDCKKILLLFYYDRLKMKNIMQAMGYKNEQVAKNKKSQCMRKLRDMVLTNQAYMQALKG